MKTVPAPVIVSVLPLSVAGPETSVNAIGSPEVARPVSANGASPNTLSAGANVSDCDAWFTSNVRVCGSAAS